MNRTRKLLATTLAATLVCTSLVPTAAHAATLELNSTFNTNVGATLGDLVASIAIQTDGKVVVGGSFTDEVARFNVDGTPDTAFNTNVAAIGIDGAVTGIGITSTGQIVAAGAFNSPTVALLRINADGTPDTAFNDNINGGGTPIFGADATGMAIQPDDKILVGGNFDTPSGRLARITTSGTLDTDFTANLGSGIAGTAFGIAVRPGTGEIVVGGEFSSPAPYIAQFASDGTPDASFNANATFIDARLRGLTLDSEGRTIAVGTFTSPSEYIARINEDGTADTAFNNNVGDFEVEEEGLIGVGLQPSGQILVGGDITVPSMGFAMLHSDGTMNDEFNTAYATTFDGVGTTVNVQSTATYVGGYFTTPSSMLAMFGTFTPDPTPPTPSDKKTQTALNDCVVAPTTTGAIPLRGTKTLMKPGCATNAGNRVGVRVQGKLTRGDIRTYKLVCQNKSATKATKRLATGYRYCTSGRMRIKTYGNPLALSIRWYAPGSDTFTTFSTTRKYRT